jgi:hypothetical protein
MRTSPVLAVAILIAVVAALIIIVDPALAQYAARPSPAYRGAPGPIAGAGLITVAIGVGAYWLIRHFRNTG